MVWKLDRLRRNLKHLVTTLDELHTRGVGLRALSGAGAREHLDGHSRKMDVAVPTCTGNGARPNEENSVVAENEGIDPNRKAKLRRAIEEGLTITGGAISGVLGFLSGDLASAMALGGTGVATAGALGWAGGEILDRLLGPRERKRVGAVLSYIYDAIDKKANRGEQVRTDGFFDRGVDERSDAEQIAESVLLRCQREPEEKKIRYMGHFFCNVAFESSVSADLAHQLLKHAEQMTYRQFCLLKISQYDNDRPRLRDGDYRNHSTFPIELQQILYEVYDLYQRGFVNFGGEVAFGPTDVKPRRMKTQGLGTYLALLLDAIFIPEEDLEPIIRQLQ